MNAPCCQEQTLEIVLRVLIIIPGRYFVAGARLGLSKRKMTLIALSCALAGLCGSDGKNDQFDTKNTSEMSLRPTASSAARYVPAGK